MDAFGACLKQVQQQIARKLCHRASTAMILACGRVSPLSRRFKNDQEGFACGGSGTLFKTMDGGKTWQRDRSTDQIAGNLYAVKYTPSGTGFILGNDGILLRNFG